MSIGGIQLEQPWYFDLTANKIPRSPFKGKNNLMDFTIELQDMVAMLVSMICGGIIGFGREYRSKSAGFSTIILISLGSTIFTIVSRHGVGTDDRISANIITGIGFIGAGVIFKDKISVSGLTTAAVIWTSAAIGMTTGIGYPCPGAGAYHYHPKSLIFSSKMERL